MAALFCALIRSATDLAAERDEPTSRASGELELHHFSTVSVALELHRFSMAWEALERHRLP